MSEESRPDPDALLAEIHREESSRTRGRLRVFLGMCPGVGKTYAMLLAAQQRQQDGVDVVIGYIETHGRVETTALTMGLPRIPRRNIAYRDGHWEEMDLDGILERKPALVLIDELAHSNFAGSRHPKRWQDVAEVLAAGIDVYTTLNVQHIESYRDVVAQITGAPARECVPDSLIDAADVIELIDVSPAELRKRLEEGKVYLGERAISAAESFFREGNLKALREIALRVTAEKADRELRDFMRSRRITDPWKSRERYLVAVGPSPFSNYLIRWTRRICALTHGTWMAIHVDQGQPLPAAERERLEKNLTLARSLGAEVQATTGSDLTKTLLRIARENNITQIVVGKPVSHPLWDFLRGGSLVDRLMRQSGDIDISVVRAEKATTSWRPNFDLGKSWNPRALVQGLLVVAVTTGLGLALAPSIGYMAVGLLYLLSVMGVSLVLPRWPTLFVAALTAFAWNFLFITPAFTFYINNAHDVILFGTYFVVALLMGHLTTKLRQREGTERIREQQATALYQFGRDVAGSPSLHSALQEGARHIDGLFGIETTILLAVDDGGLSQSVGEALSPSEFAVAAWCRQKNESAGRFTNTLSQAQRWYLPLAAGRTVVGVLGLKLKQALTLPERQLIETFAAQMALLIERDRLTSQAERTRIEERSRHLQKTLLDSVSHEFKTPLAVISSAVESLEKERRASTPFIQEIRTAAARLNRIVSGLLDMTRIETGTVKPRKIWCELEEVITEAIHRVSENIADRIIRIDIKPEVSACEVDPGLLEEMLANLIRNAAQHSPPASVISIEAYQAEGLCLRIEDEGPGLGAEAERLFDKFQRGASSPATGLGLGLSIVRGFAEALGGSVSALARKDGRTGAALLIRLPVQVKNVDTICAEP